MGVQFYSIKCYIISTAKGLDYYLETAKTNPYLGIVLSEDL